jgi:hypothetical protein
MKFQKLIGKNLLIINRLAGNLRDSTKKSELSEVFTAKGLILSATL